ncbi:hypothetical protein BDQ17DRAFT_1547433 [Cyathus striatus]|nr:hypothetical protein BDQ17DRAFT_1547433 [Cyathus striatus]
MTFSIFSTLATVSALAMYALAEQHTIIFDNRCGFGTPHLVKGSTIYSYGDRFTSSGPFESAIAHSFNVPVEFIYEGGSCTGNGAFCDHDQCKSAFLKPTDTQAQVQCQETDVNLKITFCPPTSPDGRTFDRGLSELENEDRLMRLAGRAARAARV